MRNVRGHKLKMKVKQNIISVGIITVLLTLLSCANDNKQNNNVETTSDSLETKAVLVDSIKEMDNQLLDIGKLKTDLDTFAITIKNTHVPFELKTDTVNENSSKKQLWAFQKGIFELINPDSTELLIRNHFFIPKTKRILRLYILELKYSDNAKCSKFFQNLVARKDYKADLTGGYFLNYGLTGTTDYVIKLDKTILWFNVSCQYSKSEFNQLIEIFRKNISVTENEWVIKCYCHELCE